MRDSDTGLELAATNDTRRRVILVSTTYAALAPMGRLFAIRTAVESPFRKNCAIGLAASGAVLVLGNCEPVEAKATADHVLGHVIGVRDEFKVRRVVVSLVFVAVMYVEAFWNRPVMRLPDLAM
jgi:hypothetical protein